MLATATGHGVARPSFPLVGRPLSRLLLEEGVKPRLM